MLMINIFSTESIAQFLGIDNQEVIETTKKSFDVIQRQYKQLY